LAVGRKASVTLQILSADERSFEVDQRLAWLQGRLTVTDPVPRDDVEHRLVAADAVARRANALERRLEAVTPMTTERWDSLAIEDLSEDEAEAFWQAIAG